MLNLKASFYVKKVFIVYYLAIGNNKSKITDQKQLVRLNQIQSSDCTNIIYDSTSKYSTGNVTLYKIVLHVNTESE